MEQGTTLSARQVGKHPTCHQLSLEPTARSTDPRTSHLAASSISKDKLRASQEAVLKVLRGCGPVTQAKLVDEYIEAALYGSHPMQSDSGIRTRLKELVRMGKARDTGRTEVLASGRKAIVWEALC